MTLGQRIKTICLLDLSLAEYCLQLAEDRIDVEYLRLRIRCHRWQRSLKKLPEFPKLYFDVFHPRDNCWMCFTPDCRTAEEVEYWLKENKSKCPELLWFDRELEKLALRGVPLLSDPKSRTIPGGRYTHERLISVERLLTSAGLASSTRTKLR